MFSKHSLRTQGNSYDIFLRKKWTHNSNSIDRIMLNDIPKIEKSLRTDFCIMKPLKVMF